MTHPIRTTSLAVVAGAMLLPALPASAVFTTVTSQDTPHCDPLMNLTLVDELGNVPPFPSNEAIFSAATFTQQAACPSHDNPTILNAFVRITNLTPLYFSDLHYVADPNVAGAIGTSISNEDGIVNGGQAFRIDKFGVNTPLLSESITSDHIFEPGESWDFIIDDYVNTGALSPAAFDSIGVGFASFGPPSSGSIIALVVPEPGSIAAVGVAGSALLVRRRRQ